MDFKLEKEAFVSGLEGTTVAEINLITVTLLSGYLLRCCCLICLPLLYSLSCSSLAVGFLLEYVTIILPAILVFTILANYAVYVLLAELFVCCALIAVKVTTAGKTLKSVRDALVSEYPVRHPYLTVTRTYVNLFTAVAILAVDFSIYPRRLAKAETYGSGLMDIGVGAFLMAHGLTSPEAREARSVGSQRLGLRYLRRLRVTFRHVLPLVILGILRLLSVKSTGYQEHVTEYGVHWNFFFTIAAVRILCSLLHPLLVSLPYGHGVVAVVMATLYQVLLQWGGMESYVLLGPDGDSSRIGLISANREGIVSCVGYLAIYMGWIQVGKWLFKARRQLKDFVVVLLTLVLMFASLWLTTSCLEQYIHPISRRLVNLSYIVWMFSYGALILSTTLFIDLTVLLLAETTHMPRPPPYCIPTPSDPKVHARESVPLCATSAVNYNQLGFFVLANVFTGLVNLSMDTLHASSVSALSVLLAYMALMLLVFVTLHRYKLKIKI